MKCYKKPITTKDLEFVDIDRLMRDIKNVSPYYEDTTGRTQTNKQNKKECLTECYKKPVIEKYLEFDIDRFISDLEDVKFSPDEDPDITLEKLANEVACNSQTEDSYDNVNRPAHYNTGKYESIDVMVETQGIDAVKNFCICNAFKYIYRHRFKNGVEDIKKAIWYLNKYVELEESNESK